jgi:hypothetical protein
MVKLDSAREARTPAPVRAKPVAAKAESGRGWAGEARGPATLEIQDAGVSDSGVFVELADPQNPSRSYRMTVELDQRHMEIKSALLQAGAGPPKRFRLTNASAAGRPAKPEAETLRRPMQERRSVKPKWETRAPQGEFAYKRRTRTMPLSESELTE